LLEVVLTSSVPDAQTDEQTDNKEVIFLSGGYFGTLEQTDNKEVIF
jgi:hypothetical protein